MNFTREPIIETVITPKEGFRLLVRSSRNEKQEEYSVEAVEVISFGQALFFRSLERPNPFLVPVGDYEVVEVKEGRMALKSASFDRPVKIGGGRDAPVRREAPGPVEEVLPVALEEESEKNPPPVESPRPDSPFNKKQERRHHRRRRGSPPPQREEVQQGPHAERSPVGKENEPHIPSPLIRPPTTLISQTLGRYKEQFFLEPPQETTKKEE